VNEGLISDLSKKTDELDFDEDFIRTDALICEYDSVGNLLQRKGESAFQWAPIESTCSALLNKISDIRVAIWYIRACMAERGIAGLAVGVGRLADIMDLPSDQVHPRAQPGDSVGDIHALHLGWIMGSQFLHQLGRARFEEADITLADLAEGEAAAHLVGSGFKENAYRLLLNIKESLLKVEASMLAETQQFDISRVLALIGRALSRLSPTPTADAAPLTQTNEKGEGRRGYNAHTVLATRQDVGAALECIAEYFRVREPSHPAPIFLSRIQRMLGAGFDEVMAELYPDGVALAAQLGRPGGVVK
jgi:type VI secretion system protein ImpA